MKEEALLRLHDAAEYEEENQFARQVEYLQELLARRFETVEREIYPPAFLEWEGSARRWWRPGRRASDHGASSRTSLPGLPTRSTLRVVTDNDSRRS
jgi:hypothetical protein